MKNREQINEALQTGVKALDLLTPIGRGASMLLVGPDGSGFEQVAEDAIIGQKDSGGSHQ
jgi:F-type H+-transporting ATPase subunit alpha